MLPLQCHGSAAWKDGLGCNFLHLVLVRIGRVRGFSGRFGRWPGIVLTKSADRRYGRCLRPSYPMRNALMPCDLF